MSGRFKQFKKNEKILQNVLTISSRILGNFFNFLNRLKWLHNFFFSFRKIRKKN
jgi:hypothetical protein